MCAERLFICHLQLAPELKVTNLNSQGKKLTRKKPGRGRDSRDLRVKSDNDDDLSVCSFSFS